MNAGKFLMKISYGFIAALVIVLVSLLVYEQWQIWRMSQNEGPAPSEVVTQGPVNTQTASAAGDSAKYLSVEADDLIKV